MYNEIIKLYNLASSSKGISKDAINKVLLKLKSDLPKTLLEYYLLIGKENKVNSFFNRLVPATKLYFIKDYLIFFEENQECVLWAILKNDLKYSDPKVYASYDNGETWIIDGNKLSEFLISMALWQASIGALKFNANKGSIDKSTINIIEMNNIKISKLNNWDLIQYTNNYNNIINITINKKGTPNGIYVAANSKKEFEIMNNYLNIEWDYSYDDE
jgi:hypothetical protein